MPNERLSSELKKLRGIRLERDGVKNALDELEDAFRRQEALCFELMEDEDVQSSTVEGISFGRRATVYAQVQDRAEFVEWCELNAPELVEQRERKALINQVVRERIDNGQPLPPGVGFYVKQFISQRAG